MAKNVEGRLFWVKARCKKPLVDMGLMNNSCRESTTKVARCKRLNASTFRGSVIQWVRVIMYKCIVMEYLYIMYRTAAAHANGSLPHLLFILCYQDPLQTMYLSVHHQSCCRWKKIPNNHLGCIKSCKKRDKLPINWLAGFLNHQQYVLCPGAKLGFLPAGPARTPRALRTLALLFREAERTRRVGWCHGTLLLLMSGEYTFHEPQNLHFERFLC